MAITKEQWQQVEKYLTGPYGRVVLQCDEYLLTLTVALVAPLRSGIAFYVDGNFKGKWIIEDCEERRRFCRPITRHLWDANFRSEMTKVYGGKRAPKKDVERINQKLTTFSSYWTNFTALRRHLQKGNVNIELVSVGYEP
jgi:hypothetical protein